MGGQNCVSAAARLQEKLPPPLHLLVNLAFNFWWSWSPELSSLFRKIDPHRWEQYCYNPVKLLNSVSFERFTQLATEPYYCSRILAIAAEFKQYRQKTKTWASVSLLLHRERMASASVLMWTEQNHACSY